MKGRDPNEILVKEGADAVRRAAESAKPYTPEPDKPKANSQNAATEPETTAGKPRGNKASVSGSALEDRVALHFAKQHAGDFRFIAKWGRWMKWDGNRWHPEDTLRAFDISRKLCRDAGDAKARTVAAVVTHARSDRAIAATEDQWDGSIEIFNTIHQPEGNRP
jgi:putative DNA primase/helicase